MSQEARAQPQSLSPDPVSVSTAVPAGPLSALHVVKNWVARVWFNARQSQSPQSSQEEELDTALDRFTLVFKNPVVEQKFLEASAISTVGVAWFLILVFWLSFLVPNMSVILDCDAHFSLRLAALARVVGPGSSVAVLYYVNRNHHRLSPAAIVRLYDLGINLQLCGDLWSQSFIAGTSCQKYPPAILSISCATVLIGKTWMFNAGHSLAMYALYAGARIFLCDNPADGFRLVEVAFQLPVMWLIGYVANANSRLGFFIRSRLSTFRSELAGVLQSTFEPDQLRNPDAEVLAAADLPPLDEPATPTDTIMSWVDLLSDLQRSLEQARAANKIFAKAEARQAIFLASMSHELRSPLTTMIGFLELILLSATDEQRDNLDIVYSSSNQLLCLVNDILDFSKLAAVGNRFELSDVPFQPRQVAEQVQTMFSKQAQDKLVRLELVSDVEQGLEVRGDPVRLQQVITNLVSNALKFTDAAGRVTISLTLRGVEESPVATAGDVSPCVSRPSSPKSRTLGRQTETTIAVLQLSVEDTGIGMGPQTKRHLFEPFVQGKEAARHGTGLGLAISSELVKLMGGNGIDVESTLGKGSRFTATVRLPLVKQAAGSRSSTEGVSAGAGTTIAGAGGEGLAVKVAARNTRRFTTLEEALAAAKNLQGYRVLLVEDVSSIRTLGERMITRLRATCETATNGLEAVAAVARDPAHFHCVLMDLHMPFCDGLRAMRLIRKAHGEAAPPVLGLTADVMDASATAFLQSGSPHVLHKPYNVQKILHAVLQFGRTPQV
eukprot:INCI5506.1.p1 GENE.INCI5506.1~~INCI5506.1.p1  ORF type:complete len:779 (+),score=125.47 INCI5506.1:150-2486(+)